MEHIEKVAVVTGSQRGIGYEIVKNLSQEFKGIVYLTCKFRFFFNLHSNLN